MALIVVRLGKKDQKQAPATQGTLAALAATKNKLTLITEKDVQDALVAFASEHIMAMLKPRYDAIAKEKARTDAVVAAAEHSMIISRPPTSGSSSSSSPAKQSKPAASTATTVTSATSAASTGLVKAQMEAAKVAAQLQVNLNQQKMAMSGLSIFTKEAQPQSSSDES